jgi:hypothetical protein
MYSLDTLHPDRLRCDSCDHALPVALDHWDGPAGLRCLTEDEAAAYWPGLAGDLRLHGMMGPGVWFAGQEAAEMMAAVRGLLGPGRTFRRQFEQGCGREFTAEGVDQRQMLEHLQELEAVAVRALDVGRSIVLL